MRALSIRCVLPCESSARALFSLCVFYCSFLALIRFSNKSSQEISDPLSLFSYLYISSDSVNTDIDILLFDVWLSLSFALFLINYIETYVAFIVSQSDVCSTTSSECSVLVVIIA